MSLKQVIVVRKDLNMRKGKMIAQGAHASITAYELSNSKNRNEWLQQGQKKIAVGVNSEAELGTIFQRAIDAGITASLITDAGHTEFKGAPTKTAVAIGPWNEEEIDEITGDLSLL